MFVKSPCQKYHTQKSMLSQNLSTVSIQEHQLNKHHYLQKNLSPKMRVQQVNFSTKNKNFQQTQRNHNRNLSKTDFQKFQFNSPTKITDSHQFQQYTFKFMDQLSVQSPPQIHIQTLQRFPSNENSKMEIYSPKERVCPNCCRNPYYSGSSQNSIQNLDKELKHPNHPLSNSIYLKSFNQSYQPMEYHSPKINLERRFQESAQKYLKANFLSPVSSQKRILKKQSLIQQISTQHDYFPKISLNNQLILDPAYPSQSFEEKEEKSLKETRQVSQIGTESSEKKQSRDSLFLERNLPQFHLDQETHRQIKSYLDSNDKFIFESPRTNYKQRVSFVKKNDCIQQKTMKSPPKQEILIEEYDLQNQILEKDIEELESEIQDEIQKERRLLDRLNFLMEKLQTLKENQVQRQAPSIKEILSLNWSSKSILLNKNEQAQTCTQIKKQKTSSRKQSNHEIVSFQKPSYLTPHQTKLRGMKYQEKENISICSSSQRKILPGLKKDSLLFKNLINVLPDINESAHQSFTEQDKKQQKSIDGSFSVFESKYVPKMNNLQKLKDLQELFEEQLKKGFFSTKTLLGSNDDLSRKQKLKRLSQEIKQLRELVSEQELSHFDE